MSGDVHAGFCEHRGVRFPPVTLLRIYVGSERAGRRVVMQTTTMFIEQRLKLRVSAEKSALEPAAKGTFPGSRSTAETGS